MVENQGLRHGNQGIMVVHNPFIRPYFLEGWHLGGPKKIPMIVSVGVSN